MDYNARWYSPSLGRFTQPDTIVPNLFNPQSLNRYTYTRNNPVNYSDPSGHDEVPIDELLSNFNITADEGLSRKQKIDIYRAAWMVGNAFKKSLGGPTNEAFKQVYGSMHFKRCNKNADTSKSNCNLYIGRDEDGNPKYRSVQSGMVTLLPNEIGIARGDGTGPTKFMNNVIHEMGHAFNKILKDVPATTLGKYYSYVLATTGINLRRTPLENDKKDRPTAPKLGFYSTDWDFQVAGGTTWGDLSEDFADMFVAWVWGESGNYRWEDSAEGDHRKHFMDELMPYWLIQNFGY